LVSTCKDVQDGGTALDAGIEHYLIVELKP